MSESPFSHLKLYGAVTHDSGPALSWRDSSELRRSLLQDISTLDRQRELLEEVDGKIDFSLQQTCREMIHSRQRLYCKLRR